MTKKEIVRYIIANMENGEYQTRKAALLHSLMSIPCSFENDVYLNGSILIRYVD